MRNISTKRIISDKELPAKKRVGNINLECYFTESHSCFLGVGDCYMPFSVPSLEATKDDLPEIEINAYCIVDQAV